MEIKSANSKVHRYKMTWAEVYRRLTRMKTAINTFTIAHRMRMPVKIYGIPRGGMVIAGLLSHEVNSLAENVDEAEIIVDDIIDSGTTASDWARRFGKPVFALVNKRDNIEDSKLGWVVFPWERGDQEQGPEDNIRRIIEFIGEDPNREGLRETPSRVLRAYEEMTSGYRQEPMDILAKTFDIVTDEMVVLDGIRFSSLCEHHLLPFTGTATVGYIPSKRVVGISKLARLVDVYARRLQVQERMTYEIAYALMDCPVKPIGVGVIVKASHQ